MSAVTSTPSAGAPSVSAFKFHDFAFLEHLGQGAYGLVCKVRERSTGKIYALKIQSIFRMTVGNVNYKEEIKIQSALSHPNIVSLHGWFIDRGPSKKWLSRPPDSRDEPIDSNPCVYMVLDFVPGGDLYAYTKKNKLDERTILAIGKQLASGIEHLHRKGVIHRDIKLENVLIESIVDGIPQVKISDFGFATTRQIAYDRVGTIYDMAPELVKGIKYDKHVDLWSLGVLVYELSNGRPPFDYVSDDISMSPDEEDKILEGMIIKGEVDYTEIESEKLKGIIGVLLSVEPTQRTLRKEKTD